MTLVVTTATSRGITVVGDRAEREHLGELGIVRPIRTKVFYSESANVSFAIWGDSTWPLRLGDYSGWFLEKVVRAIPEGASLAEIGQVVCDRVNPILVEDFGGNFKKHRRGVHVAGYVDGLPHIYHCHMGHDGEAERELSCYHDYPGESDLDRYRQRLTEGPPAQLRNGRPDLYGGINQSIDALIKAARERGIRIPAPTIDAQLAFDSAIVRFASGLMEAAGYAPTVSLEVDVLAFNTKGPCKLQDPNEVLGRTMPALFMSPLHRHSGDATLPSTYTP